MTEQISSGLSDEQVHFDAALKHISLGEYADAEEHILQAGGEAVMDILRGQIVASQKIQQMLVDRQLAKAAKIIKGSRLIGDVQVRMKEELIKYEAELADAAQTSTEEGKKKRADRTLKHLPRKVRKKVKEALSEKREPVIEEAKTSDEPAIAEPPSEPAPSHGEVFAPASPGVELAVQQIDDGIKARYWNQNAPRGLTGRQRVVVEVFLKQAIEHGGAALSVTAIHALTGLKKSETQKILRDMKTYLLRDSFWELHEGDDERLSLRRRAAEGSVE